MIPEEYAWVVAIGLYLAAFVLFLYRSRRAYLEGPAIMCEPAILGAPPLTTEQRLEAERLALGAALLAIMQNQNACRAMTTPQHQAAMAALDFARVGQ